MSPERNQSSGQKAAFRVFGNCGDNRFIDIASPDARISPSRPESTGPALWVPEFALPRRGTVSPTEPMRVLPEVVVGDGRGPSRSKTVAFVMVNPVRACHFPDVSGGPGRRRRKRE